ncbi:MAG: RrF2 family transcriptional regulator [Clostridia bacterium]|nr:RrF2 family transcriptional regulator [Lachnospiraceae bacterium]NCB99154.1 RrF2 family transcriptional regulator [Clostridia bacterium]NCD02237.1 RrF2 family transcriptional regulator [Clostridia bacterium]
MKISTKGRYALRTMIDLSMHDKGALIPLKDISSRQGITIKYLEQVMTLLSRAGYVRSVRGANGGYRLAKEPSEYTAGDILRVAEGSLMPVACLEDDINQCPRAEECLTLEFWEGLADAINQYVDSVTLEDLVNRAGEGGNFSI